MNLKSSFIYLKSALNHWKGYRSLEKIAEMTGVSKTMLGQIERGEASPIITTVWKIVNGSKISFSTRIDTPQPIFY